MRKKFKIFTCAKILGLLRLIQTIALVVFTHIDPYIFTHFNVFIK